MFDSDLHFFDRETCVRFKASNEMCTREISSKLNKQYSVSVGMGSINCLFSSVPMPNRERIGKKKINYRTLCIMRVSVINIPRPAENAFLTHIYLTLHVAHEFNRGNNLFKKTLRSSIWK